MTDVPPAGAGAPSRRTVPARGPARGPVRGLVRVRVPATSANLGPGFDSLGLALTLYDDVEVEVTPGGAVSIEVTGEGAEIADRGENHLIVSVIRRAFEVIDARAGDAPHVSRALGSPRPRPGLRLRCVNGIPHSRGLGSSAAAIVAGLLAARALHPYGRVLDDQAVFALATELEGHPDNVAPCLAGGLTIAWQEDGGPRLARVEVDLEVVVFVPAQRLATEQARGLLPEVVPHRDAAANAGRAALLIAALAACRTAPKGPVAGSARTSGAFGAYGSDVLLAATEDRLHQDYRASAMPASATLLRMLRKEGIPAVLSGAGPAVLAFTSASRVDSIASEVGNGWHKRALNVDPDGARVQLHRP
jgi:homoserine kinase